MLDPKISKPKILYFTVTEQGVGLAVFGKGFIAVLQEMYTSVLNSHIRLKDQHQEEHQHCILQPAPHHMLALPKNVPHGLLSLMPMMF